MHDLKLNIVLQKKKKSGNKAVQPSGCYIQFKHWGAASVKGKKEKKKETMYRWAGQHHVQVLRLDAKSFCCFPSLLTAWTI